MRPVPFPKTKLRPPALRQPVVRRPRLTRALADRRPLTVVCAPAGSGKTTLALEWLASDPERVAWLSLDPDDNDPVRFIHGMIAALQAAGEKIKLSSGHRDLKTILVELINQLGDADRISLVLDDYHLITEPEIHSALAYLLEHIPACLQLVLISREEPPLPLARLRARGQVHMVGVSDLRFTLEETRAFFHQAIGLELPVEQLRSLEQYTQGWAAGLQMAALSGQAVEGGWAGSPEKPGPAGPQENLKEETSAGEPPLISEYLLAEVFNQQPPEVQIFLLHTSILERFSLPLCKAILPQEAGRPFKQVEKANLFVTAVGAWRQYHPLFRDFLQAQLQERFPERVEELRRRALGWLEENGYAAEAVAHALSIPDYETAARLVAALAPDSFKRGELVRLRRWLDRLPEPVIWNQPRLCLTQIWLLLDSNLREDAEVYFERLGNFLEQNLRGEFLAVRALQAAMSHKPEQALRFARQAQKSPEAKDPFIQTYVTFGMGAAQKMGMTLFQAEQSLRSALALAEASGNAYITLNSLVNLADVLYMQARLSEADKVCKNELARFKTWPHANLDRNWTLARSAYQRNELDRALERINRAIDFCSELQEKTMQTHALLQRALVYQGRGELEPAREDLEASDRLARGLQDPSVLRSVIRFRVLFAVEAGDLRSARQWIEVLAGLGNQPYTFYYAWTRARLSLAEGDYTRANTEFGSALAGLEKTDYNLFKLKVLVWQAVCLEKLGNPAEGLRALKSASALAQPEKVRQPFVEARTGLARLLQKAGGEAVPWVAATIRESGRGGETSGPPLTRREREILQFLALGLSNREIAEKLVIAEGTLKRHVANLYQKLGVHNRTQAIRHLQ